MAGPLVVLAACGGGGGGTTAASTSPSMDMSTMASSPVVTDAPIATNAVTILNQAFGPKAVSVKVGTTVTWTNGESDGDSHTVTFDAGGTKSGVLAPGATYTHTFTTAGTFAYHCSIHPDMHGVVVVTP